jgi:GntR family transcriptional regulator
MQPRQARQDGTGRRVGLAKAERVAFALERDIRDGRAPHGAALESETELTRRFAVSRNTVRRGLKLLAEQGLITTRTGIGSFVTYNGSTMDGALGWTVALAREGGAVETRMLDLRRGPCARADAALGATGEYLCVDRLRLCRTAGHAISLERSRLPWRAGFERLLQGGLVDGSISATLVAFGLVQASGWEAAGVLPALGAEDAAMMGRAPGQPMLRLERVVRDGQGGGIEYVESLLDPVRFGLRVEF